MVCCHKKTTTLSVSVLVGGRDVQTTDLKLEAVITCIDPSECTATTPLVGRSGQRLVQKIKAALFQCSPELECFRK